jgi:hypothetical protein
MNKAIATDAFNMLAGRKLGSGIHRDVFECKIRDDLVVKVEIEPESGYRTFANVAEARFWNHFSDAPNIRQWLAPVRFISPDGRLLLQDRCRPATPDDLKRLPKKLPAFLCDRKFSNYGWTKAGKLVCLDYAYTVENPSLRLTKADWWER